MRELYEAIKAFQQENRKRWNSPKAAKGNCSDASYIFHDFLTKRGFESEVWEIVLDDDHDRYICPHWYPNKDFEGHAVVYVGGVVVDWTAKQYDPKAPCPLVFVPRYGGDRKKYEKAHGTK
jgi:hypothetical protein